MTISGGTLQLGTGVAGQDGSINATSSLTNNASLVYNIAGAQSPSYVIGGSGGVSKLGAGTLVLGASETYSGPTVISGGVLQLGHASGGGSGYTWYEFSCTSVEGGPSENEMQLNEFAFDSSGSYQPTGGGGHGSRRHAGLRNAACRQFQPDQRDQSAKHQ